MNLIGYKELLEHFYPNDGKPRVEHLLKSSELIPMLALIAKRIDRDDLYDAVCELASHLPPNINYQIWFLDKDSENEFFCGENTCGTQLCSLNIQEREIC